MPQFALCPHTRQRFDIIFGICRGCGNFRKQLSQLRDEIHVFNTELRAAIVQFTFETALFAFQWDTPAFAPLLMLPPKSIALYLKSLII